jgi:hypothetical protein
VFGTVSTGSSSATKPFRVCYRGTTNCVNWSDHDNSDYQRFDLIDATKVSWKSACIERFCSYMPELAQCRLGNGSSGANGVMLGDSGSGGTQGVVPAPASDAAAGKFLKADATSAVPPGGGSGCVPAGSANQILTDDGAGGCASSVATLSSGNLSTAGSITSGAGGSVAGGLQLNSGYGEYSRSNSNVIQAPAVSSDGIFENVLAGAAATGFPFYTNSENGTRLDC